MTPLQRSPRQVSLTAAGQNNRGPMEKLLPDLGMTLLPESADEGRCDLAQVRVEHAGVNREIGLITRAGFGMSPAAEKFVEMMKRSLTQQT